MREYINIMEGLGTETGLEKRSGVLNAIFQHIRQQVDSDMSRQEFNQAYRDLAANLKFPMKIYRALSFGDSYFNAHEDDYDSYFGQEHNAEERAHIEAALRSINFKEIGVSWTFNRESARAGGVVGGGSFDDDGAHVILEATIRPKQCDLLTTLYQNLTVFQEEQEIRLWPNMPITITGITPNVGVKLPIRANTGPEKYDDRESVLYDLVQAMKG